MSDTTPEALWMGDGIRVLSDGTVEILVGHADGASTWTPDSHSSAQEIALALAAQIRITESFRQALPESERGPGWEQAVLSSIDTHREVLAAVDKHVPGWDPARPVAEVVGHLAKERDEIRAHSCEFACVDTERVIAIRQDVEAGEMARERLGEIAHILDCDEAQVLDRVKGALAERDAAKAEAWDWRVKFDRDVAQTSKPRWMWQKANPGTSVYPSHGVVMDWLVGEIDDLKARLAAAEDKAETYRKQCEADWNACCDVLVWSRRFDDSLPPPSRAVAAVCERVKDLESARDGNVRAVDALRAWEKDAAASLRRLTAQLGALHEAVRPFVTLAAQESEIEAFKVKPSSYEVLHLCDDSGRYRAVTLGDCRGLVAAFAHTYHGQPPLAPGGAAEPVSPAYEFAPTAERLSKADAADAVFAIRPVLVTDKYTEGLAVACEEFAHRLELDVGHGPPNAAGYGEARLQAHLARHRATKPTSPVYAMGPDTVWTNGRIRVHRSGTVQIGPHWDAIQDGDLQALGAAMVRMRQELLATDPYVSRVTEFHRAMGLPIRPVPSVGTVEERILRVRLLLEEVLEFAKACGVAAFSVTGDWLEPGSLSVRKDGEPDLAAMTHELGDCQVIVAGCAVQLGLPLLAAVAEEIHPANMRKLGPDGQPVLRADGKVGKPEGWKPANVARIVERALAAGEVSSG